MSRPLRKESYVKTLTSPIALRKVRRMQDDYDDAAYSRWCGSEVLYCGQCTSAECSCCRAPHLECGCIRCEPRDAFTDSDWERWERERIEEERSERA